MARSVPDAVEGRRRRGALCAATAGALGAALRSPPLDCGTDGPAADSTGAEARQPMLAIEGRMVYYVAPPQVCGAIRLGYLLFPWSWSILV